MLHTIGGSPHQNEIPFKVTFKHIYGTTIIPTSFTGPLGKLYAIDFTQQNFTLSIDLERASILQQEQRKI